MFSIYDLADAVDRLISVHQTTRAPSIAQVLDRCREARKVRLEHAERGQRALPEMTPDQASREDVQRLRELGAAGLFWDPRAGAFDAMTPNECGASLRREGGIPCRRADVNAAWLALKAPKAKPLPMAEQAQLGEVPF